MLYFDHCSERSVRTLFIVSTSPIIISSEASQQNAFVVHNSHSEVYQAKLRSFPDQTVYIYIYIYIYMCVCVCVCLYIHLCICVSVFVLMFVEVLGGIIYV
jgi:hypothetical protein